MNEPQVQRYGMSTQKPATLLRTLPLFLLAISVAAVFAFDLDAYLSFESLRSHRDQLLSFVKGYPLLAPLLFVFVYAAVTALSIPGGAVLTIAGGFLFGVLPGATYAIIGATLGATGVFLIARTALGGVLRARAGPRIRRMEEGFRDNAFNYLLVLRLIPLFPFWLVNIVPAFLGVSLGVYMLATFIGIIPGTLVYASLGNGLGALFESGQQPDLGVIFSPQVILPLLGLALLALLPVGYRHLKARQGR